MSPCAGCTNAAPLRMQPPPLLPACRSDPSSRPCLQAIALHPLPPPSCLQGSALGASALNPPPPSCQQVSALSGSPLVCRDALFVTLDPATRRLVLPSGEVCVLSDTVGFVSDLPVELVEAFKATLEEVVQAGEGRRGVRGEGPQRGGGRAQGG